MSDPAHKATDKEIERLEKKIKREYAKALDELEDKASAHFARFEEQDNRKRGELEMGYISKSEYYAWRQSQMAAGKRYETLIKDMTETLVNADKIAAGMIGERIPEVYAINSNYAAYEICEGTGANISFDLYDRNTAERLIDDPIFYPRVDIEKDERWNEKKVRSALLQGILQGDSVLKIANRLQQVTNMDDAAAVRNARTFCTRAQNAGRNDRYKEVEEKYGLHFDKEWISTDDNRTRDTHKDKSEGGVGGEVVGLDEEFSNKLQYPGDPAGDPSEVYNCRCTMRSIYRGKKKDAQEEFGKFDGSKTLDEYEKENFKILKEREAYEKSLTDTEKAVVGKYQSHSFEFNQLLRNGNESGREQATPEEYEALDSAIAKGKIERDATIFRGVSGDTKWAFDLKEGDEFIDKGYGSATYDKETAEEYGNDILFNIRVQKGQEGAYISHIADTEGNTFNDNRETLLPRNSKFEVEKIKEIEDTDAQYGYKYKRREIYLIYKGVKK